MPIERIAIVGGGVAGWLAAAVLARKTACTITLVETGDVEDSLGVPLIVESSLAKTSALFAELGIDELGLVRATGGGFTLGRALTGIASGSSPAFHGYGEVGASLGAVAFQHLVAKLRAEGQAVPFANHSVAALCAQSGRFALPQSAGHSVLSTIGYGVNLETGHLSALLKTEASARGVNAVSDTVRDMQLSDAGLIDVLMLSSGRRIEADLFLDCSGAARILAQHMPTYRFEDWSHWLPNDSCKSNATSATAIPSYIHIDVQGLGWQSFAATQNVLAETLIGQGEGYRFTSGRLVPPWAGNCLAIGGAAAVIDPIASTQLHLTVSALARLLRLFPHDRACKIEAAEYNRQTVEELENARDVAIPHYAGKGSGEVLPERLAHKIALYRSCGRVALYDEESFETWDWISMFDALGIQPSRYDAIADAYSQAEIAAHMQKIRDVMLQAVGQAPSHPDFLRQLAASKAA